MKPSFDHIPEPYRGAHRDSFQNRAKLLASAQVGCFYCMQQYPPQTIVKWIDRNNTALCPFCEIDSVLPDQPTVEFLQQMHAYWFGHKGE